MNSIIKICIAGVCCFSIASCSLFSSSTQSVQIETSSPTAVIKANGMRVGTGNAVTSLEKNKGHVITAESEGKRGLAVIDSEISTTGVLDIVGGVLFLFPFIGFAGKGAWALSKDYVYIDLE